MVQGEDLFAREAQFHQSCRKSFNLKYVNHLRNTARAAKNASDTDQLHKAAAHLKSFTAVLDFIQNQVIGQNEVVQLASLRLLYIQELERNGFPNPEYRSEKLKTRLENHDIHEQIAFAKVNPGDKGCIIYNLVYSASISIADAVAHAYKLGSKAKYEDVALLLRSLIQQAFKDSKPLPWPPTADDLEVKSPEELPPCRDNLVPHIERVNHRLANYKRADKPLFWRPKPYDPGQGWEKTEEGILEPVWSCGPILPPSLIDLLEKTAEEVEEGEEEEEHEIDYDELFDD